MVNRSVVVLSLLALACGTASPVAEDPPRPPEPPGSDEPEREAEPPELPAVPIPNAPRADPTQRVRGPVRGGFELEHGQVTAAAPILLRFWVENAGAETLTFDVGGDHFGTGPARYTWVAWGPDGEVECDLRAHPRPMAGGGGMVARPLAPGERYEEWVTPQAGCDALTRPGRHRLRVVRILTHRDATPNPSERGSGCSAIMVPDTTVEPTDDRGRAESPECAAWLSAAPAVATELEIDVLPYDVDAVRDGGRAALAIEDEPHEHAVAIWAEWLRDRCQIEPRWGTPLREWVGPMLTELPETLPPP